MATKKALTVGVGLKKVVASDLASEIIHMADSKHNSFIESKMFQDPGVLQASPTAFRNENIPNSKF